MARQPSNMTDVARRLRRDLTGPERKLWYALRAGRLDGLKVRRQVPLGRFVVDFLIASERLVIEVDGASHHGTAEADRTRQAWLESQDYSILRVGNDDVLNDLDTVLAAILKACGRL